MEDSSTLTKETDLKKRRMPTQAFPKNSLMDSLRIAQSIKANNASRPFNRLTLAKTLNYTPNSSTFRMLITSSGKFGLTKGSYQAERIELTPLAISIVMPKSEYEKNEALKQALFSIPFYNKFFTDFNNNMLPSKEILINTLIRDYSIPAEDTETCYQLLIKNATELGIIDEDVKGSKYITTGKLVSTEVAEANGDVSVGSEPLGPEGNIIKADPLDAKVASGLPTTPPEEPVPSNPPTSLKVFISHGHNVEIVKQLKELLTFGKFVPVVAEEQETPSKPVPEKVLDEMRNCFAGIIHVEGEQKITDSEGIEHSILNQNVLIEIGVAQALYGKNIILLVEKGAQLPSNLQGLYKCEYEGRKLDYEATMKLLKTFNEFVQGGEQYAK